LRFRSFALSAAVLALFFFSSCGGGSSTPSRPSGLSNRVFISTPLVNGGQIYIVDATNDTVSRNHPAMGSNSGGINASLMAITPDKSKVAAFAAILNTVSVINTQTEASVGTPIGLSGSTESMVTMADNTTLIVAEPTAPVSGSVQNGLVQFVDLTNTAVTANVAIPQARRVVLSHASSKALVFGDDYSVHLLDTSAKTATLVTSTSFDHPVNAVFSNDDNTAYILSCGSECGGTTANVAALTIGSGAVGAPTPVSGATVGVIDSSTRLYVAGNAATGGLLDVLDTASLTVTKSAIPIGDGYHNAMVLTSKGQLFIGANNCTNGLCMSILDTTSQTPYINPCVPGTTMCPSGAVTGMQPLDNRALIYVIQGGTLHIYDLTKTPPQENLTLGVPFLALLGNLSSVVQVD
jgi:hypothetical protein